VLNDRLSAPQLCSEMLSALHEQGTNAATWQSGPISLGHRLLKITPEDASESQPLVATPPHAPLCLVADARIDNRPDLAVSLALPASEPHTLPDSALILKAWQRWGPECLQHLVGAFAFALWDQSTQQLFLARDHAGERPLYYRSASGSFAFATTARAILACPGVSPQLDELQLARDLLGIPPEPGRTRFREIQALPPGHCLLITANTPNPAPRRYWKSDAIPPIRFRRDQDYIDAFLPIFDEAVRCRLRTTGKVASELSAGLDSGAVTATAARMLAEQGKSLTAFTSIPCPNFSGLVPKGLIADEGPFAAEVAALYPNIRHILVDSTGSDMLRELARIFPFLDLPTPGPLNQVWANLIADRAAASGVKVLLNGALGNFTVSYGGHELFRPTFRQGHWLRALQQAKHLRSIGLSSGRNAASLTAFAALPWAIRTRVDPLLRAVTLDGIALCPAFARNHRLLDTMRRYLFERTTNLPFLMEKSFHNNQYGDFNVALNAGWGIDARDPTADKRVYEFCAAIPPEQFVVGNRGRSLIRRAMVDRLPTSTLKRRERGTQAADWHESLTPLQTQLAAVLALLAQSPTARRLLDLDLLREAVDRWPKTAREAFEQADLYGAALPRALSVGTFIRRCEDETARRA
jgi:asparagine synthase (glutamine-hydrolysing)